MALGWDDAIAAIAEAGESSAAGGATAGAGAAGAAGGAAAGAGAAGAGAAGATTWSSLVAGAYPIIGNLAASYAIASIFAPRSSIAHPDVQTFLGNGYSNLDPINVLYGSRRIGGSRAMVAVRNNPGETNDALILVMIWGEGEVARLKTVYFDGNAVTDAAGTPTEFWNTYINLTHHVGTDDQAADAKLVGDVADAALWNANCTLSGIAYTRFTLGWRPDVFPNGRPTITCDVDGRLLYDPRDDSTALSSNPALAIRDYLTNARYGRGVPEAMIDDDAIAEAADYCDDIIDIPEFELTSLVLDQAGDTYTVGDEIVLAGGVFTRAAVLVVDSITGVGTTGPVATFHIEDGGLYAAQQPTFTQGSVTAHSEEDFGTGRITVTQGAGATFKTAAYSQGSEARYACDGVVNVDQTPFDNVRSLLSSCRGFLVYTGGVYRLKIDKPETPVSFVLNEDNIIGGWSIQLGGKRNRFNQARARFFNAAADTVPDFAVWPPAQLADGTAVDNPYLAEDNELPLEPPPLELPFTKSFYTAQRICQTEVKRSRAGMMVSLNATIAATCLEIGDVVPVAHATPGWPTVTDPTEGKLFRVIEIELLPNDEVKLGLLEYDAAVYDLDDLPVARRISLTSLPDASSAAAPGTPSALEVLYETTGSAGVKSRVDITWMAAADVWVSQGGWYELEYKLDADSDWTRISPISQTAYTIDDLAAGRYDFRIRSVNVAGVHSDYSGTLVCDVFGLTAPPSDPTGFAVQSYAGVAKFTWDKPTANTDLDVIIGGRAFVRWSPLSVGASWQDGSLVNPDGYPGDTTIGFGPLMTGTYLLKFRDSNGNYSTNAASFVVTESLLTGLSTLATVTEHPSFAGLKTNVAAPEGFLKLDGTTLWDSISGNIDTWGNVDTQGGVSLTGSYHFYNKLDLGSVKTVRLASNIRSQAFDTADNWDDRTTNIDEWGLVDGAVIEDAEVELFVRTTQDDPDPALWMAMTGTAGSGATAPDSALFPTGDIEIIAKIAATDYTPSANNVIFSKAPGAGTANVVNLRLLTSGALSLITSPNGTATVTATSTTLLSSVVADGADVWVKAYRDMDNDAAGNDTRFEWSTDGIAWTQLGTTVTNAGTTSLVDSTGLSQWGASGNALSTGNFVGKIHYGEVRTGREGPVLQKFDPTNDADAAATSFVSHTGETYTIVTNAAITGTGAPTWTAYHPLGHVADYTARGFDFRLDFASADPTHNRQVDQLSVSARQ